MSVVRSITSDEWLGDVASSDLAATLLCFYTLLVMAPALLLRGRWARAALIVAALVAALSLLGFLLQILPGFDQRNGEAIALALPIHLAFLLAMKAEAGRTTR